jgi:glycolate oxidase FAD binding subunit
VATNSSGPQRYLYGTARDLIIGIKAVFPNGDIVVSGGKTVKNVSGYDLCKLLIGSFGSLGILCEFTFKLLPLPEKQGTLLIPFITFEKAYDLVHKLLASQLLPASVETFNRAAIERVKDSLSIPIKGNYLVAIELEGVIESVERQVLELTELGKQYGAEETLLLDSEEQHTFWKAIRNFFNMMNEDVPHLVLLKSNVLISKWGETLECYETLARDHGIEGAFICHCGNGILYSYLPLGKRLRSKEESLLKLIGDLTQEAVKREGNLVVEASPPSIKKKVDVWGQRRNDFRIVQSLKERLDPKGILNPGRFVGGI